MQEPEVDLLQRGKFKAGGKLLWPRKDNGTCGNGMCCFCVGTVCSATADVPSCRLQNIYYLDYHSKIALKEDAMDAFLDNAVKLHPVLNKFPSAYLEYALGYLRRKYHWKHQWLFDTAMLDMKHVGKTDAHWECFSLMLCALEFATTAENVKEVIYSSASHIFNNIQKMSCFWHLMHYLENNSFKYDFDAMEHDLDKCRPDSFEASAIKFCERAMVHSDDKSEAFYVHFWRSLIELAGKYANPYSMLSSDYIELWFIEGIATALKKLYVLKTPKMMNPLPPKTEEVRYAY